MMLQAWGKTDKDSGEFHPLAHHSMDVAAVFARMLQRPVIRNRLEAAADAPLTYSATRAPGFPFLRGDRPSSVAEPRESRKIPPPA